MKWENSIMKRRAFITLTSLASVAPWLPTFASNRTIKINKTIPSTGQLIPAIGMGTWITFNVGSSQRLRDARADVLKTFFEWGGGMIDSSPMYGSAQSVVGDGLKLLEYPQGLFSADKIWTRSTDEGLVQFDDMQSLWGLDNLDLVQVHNLVNWQAHLSTLNRLKDEGKIKYIGITTSHGLRHQAFEEIMQKERLDFIQLTYNITHREVEERLLPLAQEKNIAVIANRPFDGGQLFDQVKNKPLPAWASDYDIANWAQFFLKFIVSHPAISCAIPATSQVQHMQENMGACYGRLPDAAARQAMLDVMKTV